MSVVNINPRFLVLETSYTAELVNKIEEINEEISGYITGDSMKINQMIVFIYDSILGKGLYTNYPKTSKNIIQKLSQNNIDYDGSICIYLNDKGYQYMDIIDIILKYATCYRGSTNQLKLIGDIIYVNIECYD